MNLVIEIGGNSNLAPDRTAMLSFLEHCFGGYLDGLHDGLIEIACAHNQGDKPNEHWHSRLFGTDELEEAAEYAAIENAQRQNIYVCPAIRHPDTDRFKRSRKEDVMGTVVLWCEWDDAVDFEEGQKRYQFVKPTAGVITGTIPYRRCQAFWRLETAIIDLDEIDAALIGMQSALFGDVKVTYASSPMRLPGSISWRKLDKPERIDEPTVLVVGQPDMPASYPIEQVCNAFPPSAERKTGSAEFKRPDSVERHKSPLGFNGNVKDGRETYMRDTIMACLTQFAGENGAWPTAQELFDLGWAQYERNLDFSRPGRDEKEFFGKCRYTARRAEKSQISYHGRHYLLEDAVAEWQKKRSEGTIKREEIKTEQQLGFNIFDWTADKFAGVAPEMRWLCKDTIPLAVPVLLAAMGGLGKSYLALDLGLQIAAGVTSSIVPKTILGGEVMASGTAVILSAEDSRDSIHRRFNAIDPQSTRLINPSRLITVPMPNAGGPQSMIASNGKSLGKTDFFEMFKSQLCSIGDLKLVVIDPLQAFVMADINADPAAGQFMWSAFAEICALTQATVLVCHHMKKQDGGPIETIDEARSAIRGSTALVDGSRLSYALWKTGDEKAKAICVQNGLEFEDGVVVNGAVVKANDQASKRIETLIRQPSGLLVARQEINISTISKSSEHRVSNADLRQILDEVRRRFLERRPFSHSNNAGGKWLGHYIMRQKGVDRRAATQIVDSLLSREKLVIEMIDPKLKKQGLNVLNWNLQD